MALPERFLLCSAPLLGEGRKAPCRGQCGGPCHFWQSFRAGFREPYQSVSREQAWLARDTGPWVGVIPEHDRSG